MSTLESIADRMYGGAPSATPAQAPTPATVAPGEHRVTGTSRTQDELAAALYGRSTPAAAAAPDAKPAIDEPVRNRTQDELAAALYPAEQMPEPEAFSDPEIQALADEPGARMYGTDVTKALPLSDFDNAIGQQVGNVTLTQEHVAQSVANIRHIAQTLNLSQQDIAGFKSGIEQMRAAAPETVASNRDRAMQLLNDEHGSQAALAFDAARVLVAKIPRLGAILDATRAGDSPEVVAIIARRALRLAKAGKLTLPKRDAP